jgi:phosphohistidine phosphatase
MELYLMQHGEARAKEEDPDRPLTDAGQATVERVAQRAAGLGLRVDAIYHSGILRARQTAEIVNRPRSWPSAWVASSNSFPSNSAAGSRLPGCSRQT